MLSIALFCTGKVSDVYMSLLLFPSFSLSFFVSLPVCHSVSVFRNLCSLFSRSPMERADMYIADSMKERGIPLAQIPGRPKQWRAKCMEILETSVTNK